MSFTFKIKCEVYEDRFLLGDETLEVKVEAEDCDYAKECLQEALAEMTRQRPIRGRPLGV